MFNPLLDDLSQIKDADLESKISDLNRKYSIAMRTGNSGLAMQVAIALEAYRDETNRRHAEATKKLMQKQNKDLDGLINIG